MNKKRKTVLIVFFAIIILFTLLKIYIFAFETNFQNLNDKNIIQIKNNLNGKDTFSFALIGNVENSIDIFDKRILPLLNEEDIDFIIFAGNSILDGGEDKYGAFYKTLEKINIPAVVAVGDNEISDYGAKRFRKHFGNYYFSFSINDSYFIFLDTTGETSEEWQKEWLISELENSEAYENKFIISNRPLIAENEKSLALRDNEYKLSEDYVNSLNQLFAKYDITAVLSSGKIKFNTSTMNEVKYISTGGGGGVSWTAKPEGYGFLEMNVAPDGINYTFIDAGGNNVPLLSNLWKNFWFRLHSWFYVGYINFILSISIIFFIVYLIYSKLIEPLDIYPALSSKDNIRRKLTIAIFTNNYLPFIGGVPISVFRLKEGLEKLGHKVYIFAPKYPEKTKEKNVIYCKPLFHYKKGNLVVPVTNIFSTKIKKEFLKIKPDVVHVHHPYWLGYVGLKLARKNKIPVVYTYHTRFEQYGHYLPFFKKLASGKLPHMLVKKFANSCDAVIAPTKSAKEYLRKLGVRKPIEVLPTGIDMSDFNIDKKKNVKLNSLKEKFKKNNEKILLSVFRLSKEKNPYFLLRGIKKIKESTNARFKCLIIGTGPEENNMKEFIKNNNLDDIVVLLGEVKSEDILLYYALADIFVFPSKSETQGIVLLEAMASSCSTVAINSSGVNDIIINGRNGFKTEDDLNEWSNKVIYLMQNKDVSDRISKRAHEFAKKYSIEIIASKTLKVYKKLLGK